MKKIYFVILAICFCLTGCGKVSDHMLSSMKNSYQSDGEKAELDSVVFYTLPSPPHYKEIKDAETVQKIRRLVDSCDKLEVNQTEKSGGWTIFLRFSDGMQVSVLGDIITVNEQKYRVDESVQERLLTLYRNSPAEEKQTPSQ